MSQFCPRCLRILLNGLSRYLRQSGFDIFSYEMSIAMKSGGVGELKGGPQLLMLSVRSKHVHMCVE